MCNDLTAITRRALVEGQATMVLSHPREAMAQQLVDRMVRAVAGERVFAQAALPFYTYTAANV